jgi:hypothetical protein
MRRECPRSPEVAAAVASGARFDAASAPGCERDAAVTGCEADDLGCHVASCASCADLVLVMSSLRGARDHSRRSAAVPAAGLVWWRAQLRQRQAAARAAAAPVTAVHALASILLLGIAVFLVWTMARGAWLPTVTSSLPSMPSLLPSTTGAEGGPWPLTVYTIALGAAASLILAPVALYVALHKD